MNRNILVLLQGLLALTLGFPQASHALADDQPPPLPEEVSQKGVEVLTRGPIHEAFAEPLSVNPRPNPIIHQKPPAAIEELPPDQRPEGTNVQWIPGYFAWDETANDYIWISGVWRAVPPGRHWMPGHWMAVGDGWQWASGYWAAEGQGEVEYLPEPPGSLDAGPADEAADADSLYIPGIWVYLDGHYRWRPGFRIRARADWFFTPARYVYTPAGCIFSEGFWDFPLERRGILFAPARFAPDVMVAGWTYQPRYALGTQGLLSSLFVRPEFGRYYFGDYYEPEYGRQGFVPWFDYRLGRNTPDPLFNYYRWNERSDKKWEENLRALHKSRLAGEAIRPPTTLIKQNEFIKNITVDKKVRIGSKTIEVADPRSILAHVPVIAPLNKVDHKAFKIVPVAEARAVEERKAVKQMTVVAADRQKREVKIISDGSHPAKVENQPARVKFEQPKYPEAVRVTHVVPPAAPNVPKHVEHEVPKHVPVEPIHVNPPPPQHPKGK